MPKYGIIQRNHRINLINNGHTTPHHQFPIKISNLQIKSPIHMTNNNLVTNHISQNKSKRPTKQQQQQHYSNGENIVWFRILKDRGMEQPSCLVFLQLMPRYLSQPL